MTVPPGPIRALLPITGGQLLVIEEPSGEFVVIASDTGLVTMGRYPKLDTAIDAAVGIYRRNR